MLKKVGMIGIGLMGHGIAFNLVKKGFQVHLLDHEGNQPLDELISGGAIVHRTPSELGNQAELVILCVTGAQQVEAVLCEPRGLLETLRPGTIVVDCSTSLPSTTQRMADLVKARGGSFLDAPITRLPQDAREGRLNLLVGGCRGVLSDAQDVLAAFTENVTHVGKLGDGHRLKLLHNYVSIGFMSLLAEAAAHAMAAGLDIDTFCGLLDKGGGRGAALDRLSPALLHGNTASVPFFIGNADKDISYYLRMADEASAHATIAKAVSDTLKRQVASGHIHSYLPELIQLLVPQEQSTH